MRYLRCGTFERALEFEMTKRQFKRTAHRITAHAIIRHLSPAACGQTHIRPMQVCQKRTVFAWVPAKDEQRTGNCVGRANRFRVPLRTDGPRRCLAMIEAKDGANFLVNF